MTKYIFLDFDGVTHRTHGTRFECADVLAKAIANLDIKIVFSTSWREYSTVERLANFLPEKIRDKCIGKTCLISQSMPHTRFHEIMSYVKEHNISDNDWIAIDDMRVLFPLDCPNLLLIDGSSGFTKHDIKRLNEKLTLIS